MESTLDVVKFKKESDNTSNIDDALNIKIAMNEKKISKDVRETDSDVLFVHGRSSSLPSARPFSPRSEVDRKGYSLDSGHPISLGQPLHPRHKTESMKYGWWCLTPYCLQHLLNNAKAFVFLVTLANVFQGVIVNGLLKVNVTTIERRYRLLSSESGFIISSYDIAGCLCLLPMSYIGGRGHKPRWISIGVLMLGLGSLILALPRFLIGPYQYEGSVYSKISKDETNGLCQQRLDGNVPNDSNNDVMDDLCDGSHLNDVYLKQMKYVFMLGQFFNGIGNTPLGVLAVTFIDENVDKRVYPIYIGIYYMGALLGPAFGFVLGGQLLTSFTNLGETPEDISLESPKWIGAWWVGFIIAGIATVLLSIPLFGYPRILSSHPRRRKVRHGCCYTAWWRNCSIDQTGSETTDEDDEHHGKYYSKNNPETSFNLPIDEAECQPMVMQQQEHVNTHNESNDPILRTSTTAVIQNFFRDIVSVVSNRAFIFLSLSAAIFSTLVSGFSTFGPKFIESQLGKSTSDAANLFGYICIPAGAGGMLIGAFLMTGLKMNHKSALQMCIAVSLVSLLAQFVLVLSCEDLDIAGITVPYTNHFNTGISDIEENLLNMTSLCNTDCACDLNPHFNPVCGGNNITYFSPCHAGCSAVNLNGEKVFRNCACIAEADLNFVQPGKCSVTCQWQNLILFSLFVVILTTFVCTVPGVDLSLRCFPYRQRSLAVGIQWILIRTLGMIPGPIIFGAMIDGTCLLWEEATCNSDKGSCLMYKNSELSLSFLVLSVFYKAAGIITLCLALFYIERYTPDSSTHSMQNTNKRIIELPMATTSSNHQSTSGLNTNATTTS
ncbi:solute carrier organic anion transporter family member 4A1-like [Styela clava]